jgi:hypothetical protein
MAALSGRDGIGQAGPSSSNGTVKASACFGVGVRDQDGRHWITKFGI